MVKSSLPKKLATAEAKLDGAVEYCNELKLEVQRLQEELAKPRGKHKVLSGGDIAWLGFSATIIIGGLVTLLCFAQPPANYAVAADKPTLTSSWLDKRTGATLPRIYKEAKRGQRGIRHGVPPRRWVMAVPTP